MPKDKPVATDISPLQRIDTLIRHQERVRENCELLGKRLIAKGEFEIGCQLISNGRIHDNSKWKGVEFDVFIKGNNDLLKVAVEHHRRINPHHVGYWQNIGEMPRVYIAELVCDLYARSQEFGSDLRDYLKEEFFPKYELTAGCRVCKTIKEFVDMLLEKPFTAIK